MSKPEWCPQDVWDAADAVGECIHGRHERGWVAWPLFSHSGKPAQEIVARAILADRASRPIPALEAMGEDKLGEMLASARHYVGANGYDPDPEEIISLIARLQAAEAKNQAYAEAMERIAGIAEANYGRQNEKLADIAPIARATLQQGAKP